MALPRDFEEWPAIAIARFKPVKRINGYKVICGMVPSGASQPCPGFLGDATRVAAPWHSGCHPHHAFDLQEVLSHDAHMADFLGPDHRERQSERRGALLRATAKGAGDVPPGPEDWALEVGGGWHRYPNGTFIVRFPTMGHACQKYPRRPPPERLVQAMLEEGLGNDNGLYITRKGTKWSYMDEPFRKDRVTVDVGSTPILPSVVACPVCFYYNRVDPPAEAPNTTCAVGA